METKETKELPINITENLLMASIKMIEERTALRSVLKRILDDLPQNRDWLDPDLEKIARELVK